MATSQRTNIATLIIGELQLLVCLPDIEITFSPRNICDTAQHKRIKHLVWNTFDFCGVFVTVP